MVAYFFEVSAETDCEIRYVFVDQTIATDFGEISDFGSCSRNLLENELYSIPNNAGLL